jgi:hypothetical protein
VSTRSERERRPIHREPRTAGRRAWGLDPAEEVALVSAAKRELLLGVHRHRLRREDLEDCYSQATLELVAHARLRSAYTSRKHIEAVLEQRFVSRIRDRRRALSGRSPMQAALEQSLSLTGLGEDELAVVDVRADLERLVMLRQDLRRIELLARQLTSDQRLVLASQVGGLAITRSEFCRRFGWTPEKYRKVAQRARARLRQLTAIDETHVPSGAPRSEEGIGTSL